MVLWAGRFSKEIDKHVNDFNSSISFDNRMYAQDIKGSIAHAAMLAKQGIISEEDKKAITAGLTDILKDIESGDLVFDPNAEDIHMFIEAELTDRIGDAGKRLHTARSRNDQVALDMKLYFHDEIGQILPLCRELIEALLEKAQAHTETVMPGYTHLQRGQPITFAHHLMAYVQMFLRDIQRLLDCDKRILDTMPLGCGAAFGTTYPIDRQVTADLLGFTGISQNSIDGVSDRDYALELASALSIFMMHLSRFSEEVILWCSWEFKFMELDDAFSTGSSIMPQKKNPDIAELVRGKTGRVYGALVSLLTTMKGIPLAYNKDMQEDKELSFDAMDTAKGCLALFRGMLATMKFNKDRMRESANHGFTNATDAADYLVKHGVPFRDAHGIVGRIVLYCLDKKIPIDAMSLSELKAISPVFEEDIYDAISMETCVNTRLTIGAPGVDAMKQTIEKEKAFLADDWQDTVKKDWEDRLLAR